MGSADQNDITDYLANIQRQKLSDAEITSGLSDVAKNIDNELRERDDPSVKRKPGHIGRRTTVLLLLSPWLVGFLAFTAYPMIATLYYSFTRFDLVNNPKWVGFDNYRFLLTKDPLFWKTCRNTLWLLIFMVPLRILWALCSAIVLTKPARSVDLPHAVLPSDDGSGGRGECSRSCSS